MAAARQRPVSLVELIDIGTVTVEAGTQVREAKDAETIKEYAELYAAGVELPPIDVFGPERFVADGFHRLDAARKANLPQIPAKLHNGTLLDAQRFATEANQTHGLRRSDKTKRRAIRQRLRLDPELSDRAIGVALGIHHNTVAAERRKLAESTMKDAGLRSGGQISTPRRRRGQDGKTYTVPRSTASSRASDPEFRKMRARQGGLERSLKAAQRRAEAADAALTKTREKLEAAKSGRRSSAAVRAEVTVLRHELGHCADCGLPDCPRCLAGVRRLEDTAAAFATEAELANRLKAADAIRRAAVLLLAAVRDRGVGSQQRRAEAFRLLEKAVAP